MPAPPERLPQQPQLVPLLPASDERRTPEIQSEIVIIDDDGTEEPFDPSSWFS